MSKMMSPIPRNYGPPVIRQPSFFDKVVANAAAFTSKLIKQILITLGVSTLRACADWLLKSGDDKTTTILRDNMKSQNNDVDENRHKLYGRTQYADPYYDRYPSSYTKGAESFPGFS